MANKIIGMAEYFSICVPVIVYTSLSYYANVEKWGKYGDILGCNKCKLSVTLGMDADLCILFGWSMVPPLPIKPRKWNMHNELILVSHLSRSLLSHLLQKF